MIISSLRIAGQKCKWPSELRSAYALKPLESSPIQTGSYWIILVKVVQMCSSGKVPMFRQWWYLLIWADVYYLGYGDNLTRILAWQIQMVCDWVFSFTCNWFFCSHGGCCLLSAPIFCRSEPQFPTSPTGCPRTQRVLNLNDDKTPCMHTHKKNTWWENVKMVPYQCNDDLSICPL